MHRNKSTSVLLLFVLSINSSIGQEFKQVAIDMDSLGKALKLGPLKCGDQYQVKVSNINLNLYRVQFNSEELFTTEPLVFPTFSGVNVEGLKELISDMGPVPSAADVKTENTKAAASGQHSVVTADLEAVRKEFDAAVGKAKERVAVVIENIASENAALSAWYFDAQLAQLGYMTRSKDSVAKKELETGKESKGTLTALLNTRSEIRKRVTQLKDELQTGRMAYAAVTSKAEISAILGLGSIAKVHHEVEKSFSSTALKINELEAASTDEKAAQVLTALVDRDNCSGLDYLSVPRRYEGGDLFLDLSITPIDPKSSLPSYSTGAILWPTKGRPYFGVSPAFYISDLYDQEVSVQKSGSGDTATYSLFNEPRGDKEFGPSLKFTGGWRFSGMGSDWGLHVSIGPGMSISDPIRPRLLYGAGVSFGREHRVVVDMGGVYGHVARRRSSYSMDSGYTTEPTDITTNRVNSGFFFSVGYMFTLKPSMTQKKKETAKETEPKKEEKKEEPKPEQKK